LAALARAAAAVDGVLTGPVSSEQLTLHPVAAGPAKVGLNVPRLDEVTAAVRALASHGVLQALRDEFRDDDRTNQVHTHMRHFRLPLDPSHGVDGGGDAKQVDLELPPNTHLVDNSAGITGGVRLWDKTLDSMFAAAG